MEIFSIFFSKSGRTSVVLKILKNCKNSVGNLLRNMRSKLETFSLDLEYFHVSQP